LCNNISKKGRCPFGDNCKYSHSKEEQKAALDPRPCLEFLNTGQCSYEHCKFTHVESVDELSEDVKNFANNKVAQLCRYVQPDGSCKFGNTCKFVHDYNALFQYSSNMMSKVDPFYEEFIINIDDDDDYEDDMSDNKEADDSFNIVDTDNQSVSTTRRKWLDVDSCNDLEDDLQLNNKRSNSPSNNNQHTFVFDVDGYNEQEVQNLISKYQGMFNVACNIEVIQQIDQ
jgi:hypothetical protein